MVSSVTETKYTNVQELGMKGNIATTTRDTDTTNEDHT